MRYLTIYRSNLLFIRMELEMFWYYVVDVVKAMFAIHTYAPCTSHAHLRKNTNAIELQLIQ